MCHVSVPPAARRPGLGDVSSLDGATQNGKTCLILPGRQQRKLYCAVSYSVFYERGLRPQEENDNIAYFCQFINNLIAFGLVKILCHSLVFSNLKQATATCMSMRKRLHPPIAVSVSVKLQSGYSGSPGAARK